MAKCSLAHAVAICVERDSSEKKTEDYGHDNLGENPPRFNFSTIDYSAMAGG